MEKVNNGEFVRMVDMKKVVELVDEVKELESFLVYDTRLALDHALRLGRFGHKVFYFLEWRTMYSKLEDWVSGYGFDEITKVWDWGEMVDGVDCIMFTDVGFGALADLLRGKGKTVFGASVKGEMLENSRLFFNKVCEEIGVKVPKAKPVTGVGELFREVEKREGKHTYVKIDKFRGNFETRCVDSVAKLREYLDRAHFGKFAEKIDFLVIDEVEDAVEVGIDTFFNGKEFLRPYHLGNEVKGTGQTSGKWGDESAWDDVLEKFEPWLKEAGYRGQISFEAMWDGSDLYVLDPTCRMPSPCGCLLERYIANYDDVVLAVARGESIKPAMKKQYTLEVVAYRNDTSVWSRVDIEPEVYEDCAFRSATKIDGEIWIPPGELMPVILMSDGNSYEETVNVIMQKAEKVNAMDSDIDFEGIVKYKNSYLPKYNELGWRWI